MRTTQITLRELSSAFSRVAIIVNPSAGRGAAQMSQVVTSFLQLTGVTLLPMAPYVSDEGEVVVEEVMRERTSSASVGLTERFVERSEPDLFLVFGGNGTVRDVLDTLYRRQLSVPVLSVGAGTTNLSPTISLQAAQTSDLSRVLELRQLSAVEFSTGAGLRRLAFIDLLFSNGVVAGNGHGSAQLLSASQLALGKRVRCKPRHVGTSVSSVRVVHSDGTEVTVAEGDRICQVIVGTIWRDCACFALAGGLSKMSLLGVPAAVAVGFTPIVIPSTPYSQVRALEPFTTCVSSLPRGAEVIVSALSADCYISADGSPQAPFDPGVPVTCKCLEGVGSVFVSGGANCTF